MSAPIVFAAEEVKREQLRRADLEWAAIPEQARCVCGHEKAVHRSAHLCLEAPHGNCTCTGFLDRDSKIGWDAFRERLIPHPRNDARLVGALRTAFQRSGFDVLKIVQPFDTWLATARRAWRAWQDAGRPMKVAKREVFHGPVSIAELEG